MPVNKGKARSKRDRANNQVSASASQPTSLHVFEKHELHFEKRKRISEMSTEEFEKFMAELYQELVVKVRPEDEKRKIFLEIMCG